MIGKEWSLVTFTLLSQMAVGAFFIVWFTYLGARRQASGEEVNRICDGTLLAVGPVVALGMVASLWHLGTPLRAWRAIGNLDTSWLSREILFMAAFLVCWLVCALLRWRGLGSERARIAWAAFTALIGFLAVISAAMIYLLPTRPAWNSLGTPVFFLASTIVLGALAAGAGFAIYYLRGGPRSEAEAGVVRTALTSISTIAMVAIIVEAVMLVVQVFYLKGGTVEAQASAALLLGPYGPWFWLRVLAIVAGLLLVWYGRQALVRVQAGVPARATNLLFAAFASMLVAEVVGRVLFYAAVVPVRLPGVGA